MLNKKGSILFIAIGVIMVVAVLSTAMLRIVSNQARLTHHQVSRIQNIYAIKAAIVYATDKLRRNDDPLWPATGPNYVRTMCRSGCDINETDLPISVERIDITVFHPGSGFLNSRRIEAHSHFEYTD
jgi:Tfp pilus assembly protein PilX